MREFKTVTKEQFWNFVMTTKRNVHPTPTGRSSDAEGFVSRWKDLSTGELVGVSAKKSGRYELRADLLP